MPEKHSEYTPVRQNNQQQRTVEENEGTASLRTTSKKKMKLEYWIIHTLRRSDDSIAKQALQWTPQGHRGRGRAKTLGKKIWRGKCRQPVSGLAGGRLRRQHKTELGGDKWSVASRGATKHRPTSSQMKYRCPNIEITAMTTRAIYYSLIFF